MNKLNDDERTTLPWSEIPHPKTGLSLQMLIRDIGREIGMRKAVYPNQVLRGRMSQSEADHHLSCAEATYSLLKRIRELEDASPDCDVRLSVLVGKILGDE